MSHAPKSELREAAVPGRGPEISPAAGLISLVFGSIALVLFFLPILGVPLAAAGLAIGLGGVIAAICGVHTSLRWSVAGLGACLIALTLDALVAYAPLLLVPGTPVAPMWHSLPSQTYVAPPARPERSHREQ